MAIEERKKADTTTEPLKNLILSGSADPLSAQFPNFLEIGAVSDFENSRGVPIYSASKIPSTVNLLPALKNYPQASRLADIQFAEAMGTHLATISHNEPSDFTPRTISFVKEFINSRPGIKSPFAEKVLECLESPHTLEEFQSVFLSNGYVLNISSDPRTDSWYVTPIVLLTSPKLDPQITGKLKTSLPNPQGLSIASIAPNNSNDLLFRQPNTIVVNELQLPFFTYNLASRLPDSAAWEKIEQREINSLLLNGPILRSAVVQQSLRLFKQDPSKRNLFPLDEATLRQIENSAALATSRMAIPYILYPALFHTGINEQGKFEFTGPDPVTAKSATDLIGAIKKYLPSYKRQAIEDQLNDLALQSEISANEEERTQLVLTKLKNVLSAIEPKTLTSIQTDFQNSLANQLDEILGYSSSPRPTSPQKKHGQHSEPHKRPKN